MFRYIAGICMLVIVFMLSGCGAGPGTPAATTGAAPSTPVAPAATATPVATATTAPSPTNTAVPTSAATEAPRSIQDVSGNLDKLKSYRAQLTASIDGKTATKPKKGTFDVLEEVINGPNDQHLRFAATGDLAPTPAPTPTLFSGGVLETYRVAGSSFFYSAATGQCQFLGTSDNPVITRALLRPSAFVGGVTDARLVRRGESQNGVSTDHYAFTKVNSTTFKDLSAIQGDVWLAQDGGYIVKLTAQGVGSTTISNEQVDGTVAINYDLTNINQLNAITLPKECVAPKLASDVPLPSNLTDRNVFSNAGTTVISFKSPDAPSVVAAFFNQNLPPQGWTAGKGNTTPTIITLNFSKGSRTLGINISGTSGGSMVFIQDKGGS